MVAIPSARLVEAGVAGGAGHGLAQVQAQMLDGVQQQQREQGGEGHGSAPAGWFGAGGHGRNPGQKSRRGITASSGYKKALPMAGPGGESRPQSGLGLCAQRRGNALAQATAPAEGGADAEQGQGAGDCGGGTCFVDHHVVESQGSGTRNSLEQEV